MLILLIALTIVCFNSLQLTKNQYDGIKTRDDNTHYFIFFNEVILNKIGEHLKQRYSQNSMIKIYQNNCEQNYIPQCSKETNNPIVLYFNRVNIPYNGDNSNHECIQFHILEMQLWIQNRINKYPQLITNKQQLLILLKQTKNWFCLCFRNQAQFQKAAFIVLSKSHPYANFCIIDNQLFVQELVLKPGNITLFKDSLTNRVEYPYANRFQMWQVFIRQNYLSQIPRTTNLIQQRFSHSPKNIQVWGIVCDTSFKCQQVWTRYGKVYQQLKEQHPEKDFRLVIANSRQDIAFLLFYHILKHSSQLPYLFYLQLNNNNGTDGCGKVKRYIKLVSKDLSTILKDVGDIQSGLVHPYYLSYQGYKNNGFFGKGASKYVQKLTASNLLDTISKRTKNYILLITALELGCQECQQFYADYKKVAALMNQQDIVFSLFDLTKNQLTYTNVTNIPQVILFKKEQPKEILMIRNHQFNSLLQFIRQHLGIESIDQL